MQSSFYPVIRLSVIWLTLFLTGCAGVKVASVNTNDYMATRRGDVLTTGSLSPATGSALQVVGINEQTCSKDAQQCREALLQTGALQDEQRLAALSELWLQTALAVQKNKSTPVPQRITAYIESARYAYAYLFFTSRTPSQRALEDRQAQVRDYYNFATQQAATLLFKHQALAEIDLQEEQGGAFAITLDNWVVHGHLEDVRLAAGEKIPSELIPAASCAVSIAVMVSVLS